MKASSGCNAERGSDYLREVVFLIMRSLAIFPVLLGAAASAQNWALLNPAYKYNYSNDGSDTISNQIFVTHIDTLGVDSFRYELNRIGVVCDTCPASMGGPCDGCFVRTNQPQFLGFDCLRSGDTWYFNAQDTFIIKSPVGIGTSWLFSASTGVNATVDAEWGESLFSTDDSLRRILLSNGDTLMLSRSFGLVALRQGNVQYDLLGVEGAGVGRLYPSPLGFFDYQPGDVLTYRVLDTYECSTSDHPSFPHIVSHYWTATITGRSSTPDTLIYTTSTARTLPHPPSDCPQVAYSPIWPVPSDEWQFTTSSVLARHPILASYPGQVMDSSLAWIFVDWFQPMYLATYGITPDGRAIVRSQHLGVSYGPTSHFNTSEEIAPGLFPFSQDALVNIWYEEGLGIRKAEFFIDLAIFGVSLDLVGAILGGDTIIPPPVIEWEVGVPAEMLAQFSIHPNPAADMLMLEITNTQKAHWHMMDVSSKQVGTGQILDKAPHLIDVSTLAEGVYVFVLVTDECQSTQRFVIAR